MAGTGGGGLVRKGRRWIAAAALVALAGSVALAALDDGEEVRRSLRSGAAMSSALVRCLDAFDDTPAMAIRLDNVGWAAAHRACAAQLDGELGALGVRGEPLRVAVASLTSYDERVFAAVAARDLGVARGLAESDERQLLRRNAGIGAWLLVDSLGASEPPAIGRGGRIAIGGIILLLVAAAGLILVRRLDHDETARAAAEAVRDQVTAAHTALQKQLREKGRAVVLANAALAHHKSEMNDALNHRVSSEAMSRAIVDNAAEGILAVESDGRVLEINPALQALLHLDADDVVGRPVTQFFPDEITTPGELNGQTREIIARRKDGERVHVSLRLTGTRLAHQLVYIGLVRDLSPVRAAQAELDALNARLMDASRAAGRADVAASVLHNIGNILNSLNVSTTLLRDSLRASEAGAIARIADLLSAQPDLGAFFTNDPRAARVPEFLRAIAGHLDAERTTFAGNVADLGKGIDHIKAVIGMQEAHAGLSSISERLSVQSVVDDALAINRAGLAKTAVTVVREFEELPPFLVDRHRVLQILVNLLRNAQHAVAELPGERVVKVRIERRGELAAIVIRDNGVGITAENLSRVFQQGYTTKSFGQGYGMHSSAIAARTMGGALTASSDGPGRGATMTLEIPIKLDEEVQRAA